ncbi:MAG TPA: hypothetical protein VH134_17995 [Candidatus Dormibacteraeota bacterium]|jgi:hypothetical protein|nr:hypothetical protein [Candidatus Dormibacteraeota bacterium]
MDELNLHDKLRALLEELAAFRKGLEGPLAELIADQRRRSPFSYMMEPGPPAWPPGEHGQTGAK